MQSEIAHYIIDTLTILMSLIISYYVPKLRAHSQNKLDDASAESKISEAWERLNRPLVERVEKLEGEIEERDSVIEDLRDWIERLIKQVKRLGGTPVKFIAKQSNLTEDV